eukprot:6206520-Pleurochrysis_carterae.AAC.1
MTKYARALTSPCKCRQKARGRAGIGSEFPHGQAEAARQAGTLLSSYASRCQNARICPPHTRRTRESEHRRSAVATNAPTQCPRCRARAPAVRPCAPIRWTRRRRARARGATSC